MAAGRLTLTRKEAAERLGVSLRHFERHIQPHIPCVYSGQLRLFPIAGLERWVDEKATMPHGVERPLRRR